MMGYLLDCYGEEEYIGNGLLKKYFSRTAIRRMEQLLGHRFVAKLAEWLDVYMIERTSDGAIVTVGHLFTRIRRK
jgi:hypothetical protein